MEALTHSPASRFDDEPAPFDESELATASPLDARTIAEGLPLDTRFRLGADLTPVQYAFVQRHGFIVFAGVLSVQESDRVLDEMTRVGSGATRSSTGGLSIPGTGYRVAAGAASIRSRNHATMQIVFQPLLAYANYCI